MPTYSHRCHKCGEITETVMSISDYVRNPPAHVHCGVLMERFFEVAPGMAIGNALAGERHYDGLQAQDGTDISTRAKHRAYMKAHNLTTVDDYSQTWKKAAEQRQATLAGDDRSRALDVAAAVAKLQRST